MASIIAENISLIYPFVGSDSKFKSRFKKATKIESGKVGGAIITDSDTQNGIRALDSLSITLKDGDRLGIFGHNGAGKSTLLKVLGGIYPPTSGTIKIDGHITGMFSLSLGINKELSGLENIFLKCMMYGLKRSDVNALIPDITAFSELGNYLHMPVKTYSSGMSLRLQFSIASALKPDILLMDEWISSADKKFKEKMDERLDLMLEETPIVIIASHSEDRLYRWANHVIHMENGRIIRSENTEEFQANMPTQFKADPDKLYIYNLMQNFQMAKEANAFLGEVWPEDQAPFDFHQRQAGYFSKHKPERTFEALTKALENAKTARHKASILNTLARHHFRKNDFLNAIDHFEQALELSDGLVGHINSYFLACEKLGKSARATKFLAKYQDQIDQTLSNLKPTRDGSKD